jgi:transcriptional regulator with XRE-family HTH domain
MNKANEISTLREILGISQKDLANKFGVSFETVNKWENGKEDIIPQKMELIYEFAEENNIRFNLIYEQLYIEMLESDEVLLFHGVKKQFDFPIDLSHSRAKNDFGIGFYLGTTFEQASTYITNVESKKVLAFNLNMKDLKVVEFKVDRNWMLAIAYYRGWIDKYENHKITKDLIKKIEEADIIIAPIADNRMFDIISEYVTNTITDMQCEHALAATNLGKQYVLKTNKAIDNLVFKRELYVCDTEKKRSLKKREELSENSMNKVSMARIEYKGKGKYIEETFI